MEGFFAVIVVIIGWAIFVNLLGLGAKAVGAAGKAAMGKGTFTENMELSVKGMQPFEVRIVDDHLNDDGTGPVVKRIEGKGLFPLVSSHNVGFAISIFDKTDGELEPVISVIEACQEEDSVVYRHGGPIGKIEPGEGFVRWVRLGAVIPELLEPPYSGRRNLVVYVRMIDLDIDPCIEHGFESPDDPGILERYLLKFDWTFHDKGYKEVSEHRDEAVGLSLRIGMAVAMADGSLDDEEGNVLKQWVLKAIEPFDDDKKERLKELYNEAMRESYTAARTGNLALSDLTSRMNEIGEKTAKYETIELCFEVMAADGVADEQELSVIRSVAAALDLNMDEVSKIRDQKIIGLSSQVGSQASVEMMLGIEPDWSKDQIIKHLRVEFQKWNNRLNILEEGEERDNAQHMLEKIAEARKKYAA